jgi:hypothetical protein
MFNSIQFTSISDIHRSFNQDGSLIVATISDWFPTLFDMMQEQPIAVLADPEYRNLCTHKGAFCHTIMIVGYCVCRDDKKLFVSLSLSLSLSLNDVVDIITLNPFFMV